MRSFYRWLFKSFAGDNWNSFHRYRRYDDGAEYGCSTHEFLRAYESDAVADAKEFLEHQDQDKKRSLATSYIDSIRCSIKLLEKALLRRNSCWSNSHQKKGRNHE
jgi:hypothetical protein